MSEVLVTGATGLIGSNVCAELIRQENLVRALVRPGSDTTELEQLGVGIVRGDVANDTDVMAAAENCQFCIHSAATKFVHGANTPWIEFEATNVTGTSNVIAAVNRGQIQRAVVVTTTGVFDRSHGTSETMPMLRVEDRVGPYVTTKAAAHELVLRQAQRGTDVLSVAPGATFGPAPTGRRAVVSGFNSRIIDALAGRITSFPAFNFPFVLASDVAWACVRALDKGVAGELYLAYGRREDLTDAASMLDTACRLAGVSHRVLRVPLEDVKGSDVNERFGANIARTAELARDRGRNDDFSNDLTRFRLDYSPASFGESVQTTVDWLIREGFVNDGQND